MDMEKMVVVKNGSLGYKPNPYDDEDVLTIDDILNLPKARAKEIVTFIMGQLDMYENDHRDKYSRFVEGGKLTVRYCGLKKVRCPFEKRKS